MAPHRGEPEKASTQVGGIWGVLKCARPIHANTAGLIDLGLEFADSLEILHAFHLRCQAVLQNCIK